MTLEEVYKKERGSWRMFNSERMRRGCPITSTEVRRNRRPGEKRTQESHFSDGSGHVRKQKRRSQKQVKKNIPEAKSLPSVNEAIAENFVMDENPPTGQSPTEPDDQFLEIIYEKQKH